MARPFEGNAETGAEADAAPVSASARRVAAPVTRPIAQLVVTDGSSLFTRVASLTWVGLVLAPLLLSIALDSPLSGAPLLGVVLWLGLLRVARWLSPAARADALAQRGRYAEALAMCEQSLAVTGTGAWVGRRRMVWLNRRVTALVGVGRYEEALAAAIVAMEASPDPQTIADCSVALLRLNRYDLAIEAARLAGQLTHGRSVRANATLAEAMLARGLPAEAEALARVSLTDIQALTPYVRREHHAACLSALCRAQRALGLTRERVATLSQLRRVTSRTPALAAIALLEQAAAATDATQAAELVMRAHVSNPAYTGWYVTQPGALPSLHSTSGAASLVAQSEAEIQRMSDRAPDDEALHLLLSSLRPAAHTSPAYQSSLAALTTQVITLGATLALLLLWMWRFFITQSL
ncbi:MAG TPA: tetratricopeptide repeat protein [Ktedonobacterales bacterium]|jgi:tetratricopeptide (TPR) repeat protein